MMYGPQIRDCDIEKANQILFPQESIGKSYHETAIGCRLIWEIFRLVIETLEREGIEEIESQQIQHDKSLLFAKMEIPHKSFCLSLKSQNHLHAMKHHEHNMRLILESMQDTVRDWFFKLSPYDQKQLKKKKTRNGLIKKADPEKVIRSNLITSIYEQTMKRSLGYTLDRRFTVHELSRTKKISKRDQVSKSMPNLPKPRRSHKKPETLASDPDSDYESGPSEPHINPKNDPREPQSEESYTDTESCSCDEEIETNEPVPYFPPPPKNGIDEEGKPYNPFREEFAYTPQAKKTETSTNWLIEL